MNARARLGFYLLLFGIWNFTIFYFWGTSPSVSHVVEIVGVPIAAYGAYLLWTGLRGWGQVPARPPAMPPGYA